MKRFIYIFTAFFSLMLFSQSDYSIGRRKSCKTKRELEDLNSIKPKCHISNKGDKKSRLINVTVSSRKKRFRRKGQKTNFNTSKVNSRTILSKLSSDEVREAKRFSAVDEVPAFPKCKNMSGDQRVNCFNREMVEHIQDYFHYPDDAVLKKVQGKVWVRFIIDRNGNVRNIKAHVSGKHKKMLKDEAIRVVSNLAKFKPAVKRGKTVSTKYGFPINFSLED